MEVMEKQGYALIPAVFSDAEVSRMRDEAERIQREAGSACVRHLRAKSALFHDLATSPRLLALIPSGLIPVRSILFDKTPEENWPVAWHQDLTITVAEKAETEGYGPWSFKDGSPHVQPPVRLLANMATIRIHLDDTPAENGALMVAPGSHRLGRIPPGEIAAHTADPVICECGPGDVLLMSPLILHASRRSAIPQRRRVIHFEYARPDDLPENLKWHE